MSNKTLVINGRLCELTGICATSGTIEATDVLSGESGYYDWFTNDIIDPHKNPEALLIAMSKLKE